MGRPSDGHDAGRALAERAHEQQGFERMGEVGVDRECHGERDPPEDVELRNRSSYRGRAESQHESDEHEWSRRPARIDDVTGGEEGSSSGEKGTEGEHETGQVGDGSESAPHDRRRRLHRVDGR